MMIIKSFWRGWEIWHEILRRSIASPPLQNLRHLFSQEFFSAGMNSPVGSPGLWS